MRSPLALSLPLLLLSISCIEPTTASDTQAATVTTIADCPIPDGPSDIAGHESDFYWCADNLAENGQGCGEDGYLAGYGAVYAERFYRSTRPRMTTKGQAWIDDVLVCFCTLHPWDILNVVWTVDGSDWVSSGAAKQAVQTALGCGRQYSGALWWFFGHLID
jgi:hypothetical protein